MLRGSMLLAGSSREALSRWEDAWCSPMLEVLASPEPRLSANVSTYALSVPLAMESSSLVTLLQRILAAAEVSDGAVPGGQVRISWHVALQMVNACTSSAPQDSAAMQFGVLLPFSTHMLHTTPVPYGTRALMAGVHFVN